MAETEAAVAEVRYRAVRILPGASQSQPNKACVEEVSITGSGEQEEDGASSILFKSIYAALGVDESQMEAYEIQGHLLQMTTFATPVAVDAGPAQRWGFLFICSLFLTHFLVTLLLALAETVEDELYECEGFFLFHIALPPSDWLPSPSPFFAQICCVMLLIQSVPFRCHRYGGSGPGPSTGAFPQACMRPCPRSQAQKHLLRAPNECTRGRISP